MPKNTPQPETVTMARVLERTTQSFCLFSAALLLLMLLSWWLFLPRLTQVQLHGAAVDVQSLKETRNLLQGEIAQQETTRDQLVLPIQDELYTKLREWKHSHLDFSALTQVIYSQTRRLASETESTIHIKTTSLHEVDGQTVLRLTGDVRNAGPSSMTVLAQLTERLREIEQVVHIQPPRFERRDDPEIGVHSPFTLQLQLR